MTCKGMLFIEFHQFEGTSHGHNFHVFLRKTQHYVLWAQKGAWQRKQETGIKFYGFILLSNWWEGSRDDLPPTPKLFPYYNLPQHINRLEIEMLSCCPLLSSTVDLWRCQGEYCAHTFVLMGTHRCFAKEWLLRVCTYCSGGWQLLLLLFCFIQGSSTRTRMWILSY